MLVLTEKLNSSLNNELHKRNGLTVIYYKFEVER